MREYFTPQRSVFPSYLTVESGRMYNIQSTKSAFISLAQDDEIETLASKSLDEQTSFNKVLKFFL